MVKINGCPNNEWPTRLTAVWGVYYVDDFGGQHTCVESLFPLEWKGGQRWEGCAPSSDADPNNLCADAPLTGYAEIGGSGPLHMDFGFSVDNGEGCVGSDSGRHEGISCDPDQLPPEPLITDLPPECCGHPNGSYSVFSVATGPPIAAAIPPVFPPPCPENLPSECCPPPGLRTGGSGQPSGYRISGGSISGGLIRGGTFGGGSSAEPCCTPTEMGSSPGCSGWARCAPGSFSIAPVRYANGEIALSVDDLASNGFGVAWGHRRSFASGQSHSESLGNGFNWHVQQWPYLIKDFDGNVIV